MVRNPLWGLLYECRTLNDDSLKDLAFCMNGERLVPCIQYLRALLSTGYFKNRTVEFHQIYIVGAFGDKMNRLDVEV